jgi:dienelactone hydrolase
VLLTVASAWAPASPAAPPAFRRHDLNLESTYCACAAIDVDGDGRLDVVSGGWWYEVPTWKRHFLRDVQEIRGRFDDYSNLPLDVNGDGRTDLVSCNYRSESIYWVENPGPSDDPWTKHEVAVPGAMETGRLVDVDGDGQLDILPNPVKFSAWWELLRDPTADGAFQPRWIRHDWPLEAAAHSVGFGDLNGDGRGDLVTPRGWLEAPLDRRQGAWVWHAEFQFERDAGIPILVLDVDRDGDNDLVWGRGHNIGLYWLEQGADDKGESGGRKWVRHAIDTSWSQPHSLLLADVDNDGRVELVTGKRYMGHDGKDPGEYDPLVIYWYKFQPETRTWHRGLISSGGPAGVGLDPKAVDLDADGDVDLIVAGRSGLFWFENLLLSSDASAATAAAGPSPAPACEDHANLLVYRDENGSEISVKTPGDWGLRRSHILAAVQRVMGELPDPSRRVPLDVEILDSADTPDYTRTRLTFAAEPGDRVPAYLLMPKKIGGKAPAMLCLHQTTQIGKDEPAGLGGRPTLHYAHELAQRGYICLVPDYPSFGEYASYDFNTDDYQSGSMKAIWNNLRAVDFLLTLPEVDPDRIGCIGHSLGGHHAIFTAVFDQRIRAVVSSCGFTAFEDYYQGNLAGWTSDRYMPRIRDLYQNDPAKMPFDFHELVAALAPRPFFVNAPLHDGNFEVAGVKKVIAAAEKIYELRGAKERLTVVYPDSAHDFPDVQRRQAYEWLDRWLK